jgi:dTDP-4-dehydrorhamnose reductase
MINALKQDGAKMAVDNIFTIALASETADVIISSLVTDYSGIVHIASPEPISRYRMAEIVIENYSSAQLTCKPCRFEELVFHEPRSKLNILDVSTSINKLHATYFSPEEILIKRIREVDEYQHD